MRIINEAGGDMNGTTNKDRTNYYETVPANQLEKVLWLEADRMGFLLDAVSQKKFEIQRATVKNERAQRIDNQPLWPGRARRWGGTLSAHPPYSWQPIGYVEDLDRVDVNDLKQFFLRWYGPNNATPTLGATLIPSRRWPGLSSTSVPSRAVRTWPNRRLSLPPCRQPAT